MYLIYVVQLHLASWTPGPKICTYFSLIAHTKKLLLVTIFDTTVGIGRVMGRDMTTMPAEGQTDVNVEIVM